jgi:alkylhydroperoxidase/carboxymuconolactone decarboxylase family protein YurZ
MSTTTTTIDSGVESRLSGVAGGDTPVLDAVMRMHLDTLDLCSLDARAYHLARLAALVAMEAPPVSYTTFLATAQDSGMTPEDAEGVLVAVAPITGAPRVTAAAGNILRGLGLASAMAEADGSDDPDAE